MSTDAFRIEGAEVVCVDGNDKTLVTLRLDCCEDTARDLASRLYLENGVQLVWKERDDG